MAGDIMTFIRAVSSLETLKTNNSGSTLILGEIVAQPNAGPDEIASCDISMDNEISRPVGIVTEASGILDTETGLILSVAGAKTEVAMVAGLTPTVGEEVIVSTTPGLGTIPGSGVNEPTAILTVLQRVGIITDISAYGGNQRIQIQIDLSQRRIN